MTRRSLATPFGARWRAVLAGFAMLSALACTRETPWRVPDEGGVDCKGALVSEGGLIEEINPDTAIAFVEFTERGNLFNRGCVRRVYDYIEDAIEERSERGGVAIVSFVHGWKHDASPGDGNVASFKAVLQGYSQAGEVRLSDDTQRALPFQYRYDADEKTTAKRKVIGVYVGWRGAVFPRFLAGSIENLSYWDRKAVAMEVGKGGVTEILLALRRLANCGTTRLREVCPDHSDNVYLAMSHSFGAAIVLSAMNEILLERLLDAEPASSGCVKTRRFSDGMILLNPAVEAKEMFQVKEFIANDCFTYDQDILMHILSSVGDSATHSAFPLGQWFSTLFFNQQSIWRKSVRERPPRHFEERDLDLTTVGNLGAFWTGILREDASGWNYTGLAEELDPLDMKGRPIENHLFVPQNSPVQVIYTDQNFIADHNDVFNDRVLAYASAVVNESLAMVRGQPVPSECLEFATLQSFNFGACFDYYLGLLNPR